MDKLNVNWQKGTKMNFFYRAKIKYSAQNAKFREMEKTSYSCWVFDDVLIWECKINSFYALSLTAFVPWY